MEQATSATQPIISNKSRVLKIHTVLPAARLRSHVQQDKFVLSRALISSHADWERKEFQPAQEAIPVWTVKQEPTATHSSMMCARPVQLGTIAKEEPLKNTQVLLRLIKGRSVQLVHIVRLVVDRPRHVPEALTEPTQERPQSMTAFDVQAIHLVQMRDLLDVLGVALTPPVSKGASLALALVNSELSLQLTAPADASQATSF